MCGRFSLATTISELQLAFPGIEWDLPGFLPRSNVPPGTEILAALEHKKAGFLTWGYVPRWAKEAKPLINARSETVAEKPSFKESFAKRRLIVFADGFYEWQGPKGKKTPYFFRLKGGKPFAMAGIWDTWKGGGQDYYGCAILTTEPNELMAPIHDRMPVLLDAAEAMVWLDPKAEIGVLQGLLRPMAAGVMECGLVDSLLSQP